MKILLTVPLLFVVGFCAQAQQTEQPPKAPIAPYTIPEEVVHQANAVKATPESASGDREEHGHRPPAGTDRSRSAKTGQVGAGGSQPVVLTQTYGPSWLTR